VIYTRIHTLSLLDAHTVFYPVRDSSPGPFDP
jgi:hypothetical protein